MLSSPRLIGDILPVTRRLVSCRLASIVHKFMLPVTCFAQLPFTIWLSYHPGASHFPMDGSVEPGAVVLHICLPTLSVL